MSHFDDDEAGTSFSSEVATMEDYYFMYRDGTQDGVMAQVRALTGQATMFPLWAMGHFQSRERYKSSDEVCNVLDKLSYPPDSFLDCMVQDWQYWGCDSNWNAMRFMNPHYINKMGDKQWFRYLPYDDKAREDLSLYTSASVQPRIKTPQDMISYLHRNNAHLMISIWANFGPWTQQYKGTGSDWCTAAIRDMADEARCETLRRVQSQGARHLLEISRRSEQDGHRRMVDRLQQNPTISPRLAMTIIKLRWHMAERENAFPLLHNMGIYEHQRAMKGNNTVPCR